MKYHPDTHHRRSIRLKGYDYGQEGTYFVTICTFNRECLFEEFPRLKRIVEKQWEIIPRRHENVLLDEYVIMPNHLHGIIVITDTASDAKATTRAGASPAPTGKFVGAPLAGALSVTENINARGKFWQRNYYEHVIRNEDDLNRIREYIVNNPARWAEDENNPENMKPVN